MWIQGNEQEELTRLRDQMATLQWMNWEYQGVYKRCDIADDYYKNFVANKLAEWSKYNMDIINGRIYRDKLDREFLSLEKDLESVRSGGEENQ